MFIEFVCCAEIARLYWTASLRSFTIAFKSSLCLCSSPRVVFSFRFPSILNFSRSRNGFFVVEEIGCSMYLISKALSSERISSSTWITSIALEFESPFSRGGYNRGVGSMCMLGLVACCSIAGGDLVHVGNQAMYVWRTFSARCRSREIARRQPCVMI